MNCGLTAASSVLFYKPPLKGNALFSSGPDLFAYPSLTPVFLPGRSRGGRGGGYRDDRRDRHSGSRRDFNSYSQDNRSGGDSYGQKKVFGNKTQNGSSGYNNSSSSSSSFNGGGYSNNGQGNFGNQSGGYGNQGYQNQQFPPNQGGVQNGMNHPPPFPFNPQQMPQTMPFPMAPPAFPQ